MLDEGATPEQIADMLLEGLDPNELDTASPQYKCDCSRERTERILISIGKDELDSIVREGKDINVSCHFCGKDYVFTPAEIADLIRSC